LEREREAPHRSARLCDPRARTRSACDTNSRLVYPTASELAWPGNWGRRSVAIGEGRGRGTAARARNRPLSAPHARNGVGIGSGVCVCQLQACRPNIMAGMQAGDALAAPPQCCGNEGLWGIAHGSPPAPPIPHVWVKTGRLTHSSPPPAPSVRRSIGDETCTGGVRTDGTRNLYHSTSHDER